MWLFCVPLQANDQVAVDHWTTDNGLPLNSAKGICQTPEGYLWIATLDGLVRFDGVRFTTYNRSNTEGIEGNRFTWMVCGSNGGFWAGSDGSGATEYRQGRFHTVLDGLASNIVGGMLGDSAGNPWVLALGIVSRWDAGTHRFIRLDDKGDVLSGVPRVDGSSIFYRVEASGVHVFAHGEQSRYFLPAGWHAGDVKLAGEDSSGRIWLAGSGKMAKLIGGRWSVMGLSKRGFSTDFRDSRGRTWQIETEWDEPGNITQSVSHAGVRAGGIRYSTLFEDREGNIWLTTDGDGLYRLRYQSIQVISQEEGLPDRNIYSVYQSEDGAVWIGTWSGGLGRYRDGKINTYTTANGLASNRVYAIGEYPEGVLWVSNLRGLHRLMRNGQFEPVAIDINGASNWEIRAIHADRRGILWLGSGAGLIRFDGAHWTMLTRKDGLASDDVRVIIDSQDGGIWAGGYGGLSRLCSGRVQAWTQEDGLPSNTVRSLHEDAGGVLWIGTYDGGLGRFHQGRFTTYTVRDGLFNNGVFRILEDARGNFWMSSNRGIYRVSKRQLNDFAAGKTRTINSIEYGRSDGMRNIECNGGLWPAGIEAEDGRLWFPTQDGVAIIDPARSAADLAPPPVVIESCQIDHRPAPIDRVLKLAPGRENVEIQYTALSFINSEHIRFKYQLSGLDRDWVEAGTRRTAFYPHLPPGSYIFRVAAAHGDGVWNDAGAQLSIVVLPAFHQTWWFASLLALTAAGSVWLGWRYRVGQLERARAAEQAFARQLIASQENERKRIAGELHDSLGQRLVIIKNRALLLSRVRDGVPGLTAAQREQVEQISADVSEAVHEVKEISYDLRPYRLDRLGLTMAVRAMIETAGKSAATSFSAEIDEIDGALLKADEINFYRIVQECVNNILKHSQAEHATIRIRRIGERVVLNVIDDGLGFTPGAKPESPTGGFGLAGISERARFLGGKATIRSAPGQGTTVNVQID
jgi:signal transduction histidine kinase/ligand-binding sensor domain-containing protein